MGRTEEKSGVFGLTSDWPSGSSRDGRASSQSNECKLPTEYISSAELLPLYGVTGGRCEE